jgi:hypothetical protein
MAYHPSITDTDALADRYHAATGKKYGNQPYITHPRAVAQLLYPYGPDAVTAGLLHDTIEDTAYTLNQMRTDGYNQLVIDTVDAVTRRTGETYFDFIRRCSRHWLGRIIKLADNRHNASTLDQAEDRVWAAGMTRRYTRARLILERALAADVARLNEFAVIGGIRVCDLDTADSSHAWYAIGHHPAGAVQAACEEQARRLGLPNLFGDTDPGGPVPVGHGYGILTGSPTTGLNDWRIATLAPDRNGYHRPVTADTVGAFKISWIDSFDPARSGAESIR